MILVTGAPASLVQIWIIRKIHRELGWKPAETFETGIRKTVRWYLDNMAWVESVASGEYRNWVETNYLERGAS